MVPLSKLVRTIARLDPIPLISEIVYACSLQDQYELGEIMDVSSDIASWAGPHDDCRSINPAETDVLNPFRGSLCSDFFSDSHGIIIIMTVLLYYLPILCKYCDFIYGKLVS